LDGSLFNGPWATAKEIGCRAWGDEKYWPVEVEEFPDVETMNVNKVTKER